MVLIRVLALLLLAIAAHAEGPPSWILSGEGALVSQTEFYSPQVAGETLTFREWTLNLSHTWTFDPEHRASFAVGNVWVQADWPENPYFDETDFSYLAFSLGGFTTAFCNWQWQGTLTLQIDPRYFQPILYALYDGQMWGRYTYNEDVGLHLGFLAEVGLYKTRAWPILGFDAVLSPRWKLNLVYPLQLSLEWLWTERLKWALSAQFLRSRHRVAKDEPLSRAIFEYQTIGIEADLIWLWRGMPVVKGFVGRTCQGYFKITNNHDSNATYEKFNGSFYGGGMVMVGF